MEGSLAPTELPAELVAQVEAIAKRLGCDAGERTLEFRLADGSLVRSHLHHGPIKNHELEELGQRDGR